VEEMKEKKYTLKVLIGNKVVRIEKVSESLVSDYISSLKKFYKNEAKVEVA